jgi:hypothetical protein
MIGVPILWRWRDSIPRRQDQDLKPLLDVSGERKVEGRLEGSVIENRESMLTLSSLSNERWQSELPLCE